MKYNLQELRNYLIENHPHVHHFLRRFKLRPVHLNGQANRIAVANQLFKAVPFENFVETGCYLGATTEFFCRVAMERNAHVYSCDCNETFLRYTQTTTARFGNLSLQQISSEQFLGSLDPIREKANFVYLDAHWNDYLPLRDELEILRRWQNSAIMIDDFRVEGESDFGFDCYANGKDLSLDYVGDLVQDMHVFFPNYSAESEKRGPKVRGYVVLTQSAVVKRALDEIELVREHVKPGSDSANAKQRDACGSG